MRQLTDKEHLEIKTELKAFNSNFEEIEILANNGYYFIFNKRIRVSQDDYIDDYIYNTNDIKVVKGWLYGSVQCINKRFKKLDTKGSV